MGAILEAPDQALDLFQPDPANETLDMVTPDTSETKSGDVAPVSLAVMETPLFTSHETSDEKSNDKSLVPNDGDSTLPLVEKSGNDVCDGQHVLSESLAPVPPESEVEHREEDIPASQPRDLETSTSDTLHCDEPSPPDVPHHILDDYAEKVLTRAEQDAALGICGKGRKPKNPNDPKVKAKAKANNKRTSKQQSGASKAEPKPKRSRKAKQQVEAPEEETKDGEGEGVASDVATCGTPPKGKRTKGKAAKAKQGEKDSKVQSPKFKEARKAASKAASKRKAKNKDGEHLSTPPARPRRGPSTPLGDRVVPAPKPSPKQSKRKGQKPKVQQFTHSTVVPYWSRDAVALKVKSTESKSGLMQAGIQVFLVRH